jgi:hypothetical protein
MTAATKVGTWKIRPTLDPAGWEIERRYFPSPVALAEWLMVQEYGPLLGRASLETVGTILEALTNHVAWRLGVGPSRREQAMTDRHSRSHRVTPRVSDKFWGAGG